MQLFRASELRVGLTPRGKVSPGTALSTMRLLRIIQILLLLAVAIAAPISGWGQLAKPAEAESEQPSKAAAGRGEEHGLSQKAVEIGRPLGFPISNSMVVT